MTEGDSDDARSNGNGGAAQSTREDHARGTGHLVERGLARHRRNLEALGGFYGAGPAAPRLELSLSSDQTQIAVLERLETTFEGRSWIGHIEGIELSSVVLTVTGGVVAGSVVWPGGHEFAISPGVVGTHVITELDVSIPWVDLVMEPPPSRSGDMAVGAAGAMPDDPSVIDLLAIYTPDAKQHVGGAVSAAAWIDQNVSHLNTALANSRVPTRVRLVRTLEIPFAGRATCGESLNSLLLTNDGNLDEVAALRDAYGADLVHLFTRELPDCGGIAYLFSPPGNIYSGFGITLINFSDGFAHEIGHNLGAVHDWYVDDRRHSGKGFVNCAAGWTADLMAYRDECNARGLPSSRIAQFSNPTAQHRGQPIDAALERLSEHDPQQSRVIELRYFGGLSIEETAEVLGVSASTIKREWRMARAWLYQELTGSDDPGDSV